jgi:hypothetical protein
MVQGLFFPVSRIAFIGRLPERPGKKFIRVGDPKQEFRYSVLKPAQHFLKRAVIDRLHQV